MKWEITWFQCVFLGPSLHVIKNDVLWNYTGLLRPLRIPHTVRLLPSNHLPPFWFVPPTFHNPINSRRIKSSTGICFILNTSVYRNKMTCKWHFMLTSRKLKIWNNQTLTWQNWQTVYTLLSECKSVCIFEIYRELCTILLKASTHSLQNLIIIILKCTRAYYSFTVYKNNNKKTSPGHEHALIVI